MHSEKHINQIVMVKSTNICPVKDCKKCLLNSIPKIVIINIAQDTFQLFAKHEMYNRNERYL